MNAVEEVYIGEEDMQTVNLMEATAAEPKSFEEAVNGPEKVEWMESMISEVMRQSVLVRVGGLFLIPWMRSHRMRTKPRAHTAIVHSCVILVTKHNVKILLKSL